jgi:hypothetical protein
MRRGPNFTHPLPQGWVVGEEGNHALVLWAPDYSAGVFVYGLSGFMQPMSCDQFAYFCLTQSMRMAGELQFARMTPVAPAQGFGQAAAIDVTFRFQLAPPLGGVPAQGVVFSNVATGYQQMNGFIALAWAMPPAWPAHEQWLPGVALQACNTGPNPFGATGVNMVNQANTAAMGQAWANYQDWSQRTWDEVSRERWASQERQQQAMDPMLTGQFWGQDPYGNGPQRYAATPAVIWVDPYGRQVTSDDPSFDPRTPFDQDWRRVK